MQAGAGEMPQWFRYADVARMREVFAYHIGDAAYEELLRYMEANLDRYQPR